MDDPYLPSSRDLMEKCISPSFEALNIQNCFDNDARVIERGNARATPSHPGVPYVVVDGTPLDNPMEVAEAICASLQKRGMKKPSACANLETVGILQSLWNILGFYKNWEE